jgi:hypothetical protein
MKIFPAFNEKILTNPTERLVPTEIISRSINKTLKNNLIQKEGLGLKDTAKKLIKKPRLGVSTPFLSVTTVDPSFRDFRSSVLGQSSIEGLCPLSKAIAFKPNTEMNPSDPLSPEILSPTKTNTRKKCMTLKVTPGAYHLGGNPGLTGSPNRLRRKSYISTTSAILPLSNMNVSFREFRDSVLSMRDDIKVDPPASLVVIDIKPVEYLESPG